MTEDSILIRAERLVRGDVITFGGATRQVRLAEPTSLTASWSTPTATSEPSSAGTASSASCF